MKKLYTVAQAAEVLNYSKEHVRRLIRKGKIEVVGKGGGKTGNYRLSEENINCFISSWGVNRFQFTRNTDFQSEKL